MYLVDTNIISALDPRRDGQAAEMAAWLRRNEAALYLSPVTIMEIEAGRLKLLRLGHGSRAEDIRDLLQIVQDRFGSRLKPIGTGVALAAASIAEATRSIDIGVPDLLIAATAKVHGMTVLTRNLRHFRPTGIAAIDPFESLPPDA